MAIGILNFDKNKTMKKLMFIISLNLLIIFAIACEKQKDECYVCTTVIMTIGSPYANSPVVSSVRSCGITESDAKEIERKMTSTVTSGNITVRSVTNCKKQ